MRKNTIMVVAGMLAGVSLIFTYSSTVSASGGKVRDAIKSKGKIEVENGQETLLIDSNDFYTLADEIDADSFQIERLYRIVGTIDAAPEDAALANVGRFYMQGDVIVRCISDGESCKYERIGSANDALTYLEKEVNELKKSVSDGKKMLTATVTELDVDAVSEQESFTTLSSKMRELYDLWYKKGQGDNFFGTAMAEQVKKGKTFVNADGFGTGTMEDNGPIDVKLVSSGSNIDIEGYSKGGSYTIKPGYTVGGTVAVADISMQTHLDEENAATANQILEGSYGFVNGERIDGKLKAMDGEYVFPESWKASDGFIHTSTPGLYSSYAVNAYWVWKCGYDEQYASGYKQGYDEGAAVARSGG